MKRSILVLLAFYISLLACLPCQDEAEADEAYAVASVQTHLDGHPEKPAGDFCSPFCICACCASVSILPVFTALPVAAKSAFSDQKIFHYLISSAQSSLALIWQPPRLV